LFPRSFEYVSPTSVNDAIALMKEYGDKAKLLAGGQSLIPLMKLRLATPQVVVDLNRVSGLTGIREEGKAVVIGAMTRHRDIERSTLLRDRYPVLADAAPLLADPLVRNRGTVGGALAHADPASDWGTTFLALGAELDVQGPKGPRVVPIDSFFKDSFTTALRPNELLTRIRILKPGARAGSAYAKLKRKTGDFATVAVAAALTLDASGGAHDVRVALGGVGPTPMRATRAEKALEGKAPEASRIDQAAQAAADEAHPVDDLRGSVAYKKAMMETYTARALARAVERAQGRKA
jgi:aerobic carbon-monoxide dehydrogenase medium subunit